MSINVSMERENISIKNVVERESVNTVFTEDIVYTVKEQVFTSITFANNTVMNVEDLRSVLTKSRRHSVLIVEALKYVCTRKISVGVLNVGAHGE